MSQYNSRIHIRVADPSIWEKFKDADDAEFGLAALAEEGATSFVLDDWSCVEEELNGIVSALAETLGKDGVIVADTTNINVDPYAYVVYSAGYGVHSKYHNYSEYCFKTNISDLIQCLNFKKHFTFTEKELKVLQRSGIERVKEGRSFSFKLLLVNEGLEDEIFLTETRLEGRAQRIETIKKGDSVKLVHDSSDKTYKNKVDVLSDSGSLGLLDAKSAEITAPIIDAGEKQYTAVVRTAIPLTARSSRCQSPIISIHVQFKVKPLVEDQEAAEKTPNKSCS